MLMIGLGGDPNKIEYDGYYEDAYARTPQDGGSNREFTTPCSIRGNAWRPPRRNAEKALQAPRRNAVWNAA